jgi:hypothetical protein
MSEHVMVCVSGFSGSGKDEFVKALLRSGAEQTGLADPAKRHMADVYGFSEQQLFGPSAFRNAGDLRLPKNSFRELGLRPWEDPLPDGDIVGQVDASARYFYCEGRGTKLTEGLPYAPGKLGAARFFVKEGDPRFWLSPREALQLYCELMNNLDINTWVRKGVDDQVALATGRVSYSRMKGLVECSSSREPSRNGSITCFADFRHIHEVKYVREAAKQTGFKAAVVRVKRPSVTRPPYEHRSEVEQVRIRDSAFDFVVENDKGVEELHARALEILEQVQKAEWAPVEWSASHVLPARDPQEGYAR